MALLLYREMALLKTVFWQFSHAVGRGHGDRVMDQAEFTRLLTDIKLCVRRCVCSKQVPHACALHLTVVTWHGAGSSQTCKATRCRGLISVRHAEVEAPAHNAGEGPQPSNPAAAQAAI